MVEKATSPGGPESPPIVIVDDEPDTLRGLDLLLRRAGFGRAVMIQDSREALAALDRHGASVLLLDLNMPFISGQEVLQAVSQRHPEIPVIIITAIQDVETAVACMKRNAVDYLVKPVEEGRFLAAVGRAHENSGLRRQVASLKGYLLGDDLRHPEAFAPIITASPRMTYLFKYMEAASQTGEPLLITGETGTGKELAARAFHALRGTDAPFVAVNVAGLDDHMFSDTLFGHVRGAFTGADKLREGMVAKAAGGVLFLDEIGDLSPASQVKLLRLLQERKYEPLGSDVSRNANILVVSATNLDLQERIRNGTFRQDLYYRLATHSVQLPALRQRPEDIPLLARHFVREAAAAMGLDKAPALPEEAEQVLGAYTYPGNIRELRALVFDAMAQHRRGTLSLETFRKVLGPAAPPGAVGGATAPPAEPPPLSWPDGAAPPTLKEAEAFLVAHALETSQGNQGVAAAMLGLTRQALNQRLMRDRKRR